MVEKPRYYETLFLTRPDIQESELQVIQNKLNEAVSSGNGEIIKSEKWAERDLAYTIKDYTKGVYYIMVYKALPSVVAGMEKHLRFYSDDILRFITVSIDEQDAVKTADKDKEPAKEQDKPVEAAEPDQGGTVQ